MNTPREEFESLTKHPGWLRYEKWAVAYIQAELDHYLRLAANDAEDAQALVKIRQLVLVKDALAKLLLYPHEQIKATVQTTSEVVSYGRGGYKP